MEASGDAGRSPEASDKHEFIPRLSITFLTLIAKQTNI
jgi:hypothetical protein